MSKDLLLEQMKHQTGGEFENRVIVLSDVCDDSITQGLQDIKDAANQHGIHLTIVGISTQFNSKTCEALKGTRGFNYFCATNEEDILKYLFETFDYTFFPSCYDAVISLESYDVASVQVFGTPDEIKSDLPYGEGSTTNGNSFTLTQLQCCFPSEIEIDKIKSTQQEA